MARAKRRSLWPREHGAYAQLAAPLVSALLVWQPTVASGLLATGAIAAFLANEPLLVMLGHRGPRLRDTEQARARALLIAFAAVALLAGGGGLVLAPRAMPAAAIAAGPTALLIVLAFKRAQHSLVGELLAAIALPAAAVPLAVAGGAPLRAGLELWAAWSIGYAGSVVGVHRVLARNKHAATGVDAIVFAGLLATLAAAVAVGLRITSVAWLAAPLLATSVVLVAIAPPAKHLRAIGVALVVASMAAIAIAVATR